MEWKGIEYNGRAKETGWGLFEREGERERISRREVGIKEREREEEDA